MHRPTGDAIVCPEPTADVREGGAPPPLPTSRHWKRPVAWLYAASVALFLAAVAQYYDPATGFTYFIYFSDHSRELPSVRGTPHFEHEMGYDGQFYAQLAVTPLVHDPAFDKAVDNPPYRARRILFSWTAYVLGLGRTAWILQAYALQNVAAWLVFAWLLMRWFPPEGARQYALWAGCLFTHGLLISVARALPDGPSALLVVAAVAAVESGRRWWAALVIGAAGLARETCLLSGVMLLPKSQLRVRHVAVLAAQGLLILLPLLLWADYLRSIYRSASASGFDHITAPFWGWRVELKRTLDLAQASGLPAARFAIMGITAVAVQTLYFLCRPRWSDVWWRTGATYAAFTTALHPVIWEGDPGAFTRVLLPMAVAYNVSIRNERWFWPLFVLGNLAVLPGIWHLRVPLLWRLV